MTKKINMKNLMSQVTLEMMLIKGEIYESSFMKYRLLIIRDTIKMASKILCMLSLSTVSVANIEMKT